MNIDDPRIKHRIEQFKAAAKKAGFKLTHQRLEIFLEVASSVEHPSAETVLRAVQKRMHTVSLDTVYRTLSVLTDLGLITTLGPRRESVRYDANLDPHHHFICVRCGLTRDFESAQLSALPMPEVARSFGRVITAQVEVQGVCDRCAQKESQLSPPSH